MAAQYPTAAGTDANLFVAANNLSTSLNGAHTNVITTITVASTTGFPTAGYITIDAEAIAYTGTTGTTFTGCTRGADGTTAASHLNATQVFHDVVAAHHNVLKDEVKAIETDLVATFSAITPATATSTATSVLNRLAMICSQIKNIGGLTNWYDAVTAMLPKSGGTMTGNITFNAPSTQGIVGTAGVNDAAAGNVGEFVDSSVSSLTSVGTSGTYANVTSISLTAGDWDVSGQVIFSLGTGTGVTNVSAAISTFTGNTTTDQVAGKNAFGQSAYPTATQDSCGGTISRWRVSVSSTTTIFLKGQITYSGGAPKFYGYISARRVR